MESNSKQVILKNTFALFFGNAVVNLLSFFLMVSIARYLGAVGVGQYSFVFAFGFFINLLANPGLEYLIVREVPVNEDILKVYGPNILTLKILVATISFALIFSISMTFSRSPIVMCSLLIVCIIYGCNAIGSVFSSVLRAKEMMGLSSLAEVMERVVAFILGFVALYFTHSLLWLVFAILIARTLREMLFIYFSRRYFVPRIGMDYPLWKRLFIKSLPFGLSVAFLYIYYRIDTVMLSLMVDDQATGWYNAAYRLIDVVNYIPFLIVTAILPPMARSSKHDKVLLRNIYDRASRYLIMLGLPIGVGMYLLSSKLINLVYGTGFDNAASALRVLIWAEVLVFVNYLGGQFLNVVDKQKSYTTIIGITAGANIALNFFLIPRYTYLGAAWATFLCEIMVLGMIYYHVKKELGNIKVISNTWRPLVASLVMGGVIWKALTLPLWCIVPTGAICYFLVFAMLKGFHEHDKDTLLTVLLMIRLKKER